MYFQISGDVYVIYLMFSCSHVAWPCDLDLWPFDLDIVSYTVPHTPNPHTKFWLSCGYQVLSYEVLN